MHFKTIKSICLAYLALLILFHPSKIDALSHKWIAVPKSQYGEQLWDQNSIQKNSDGFVRIKANLSLKALMKLLKTFCAQWRSTAREKPSEILQLVQTNLMSSEIRIQIGKIPMEIN